jgi:tetratricopeptide (TPR) repeat protein
MSDLEGTCDSRREAAVKLEKEYQDRVAESGLNEETLTLLYRLGNLYRELGEHGAGMNYLTLCYNSRSAALGPSHADTVASMRCLGTYHTLFGRANAPLGTQLLRGAYSLYKNNPTFGPTHELTLDCMADLGDNLLVAGRVRESLAILKERLDIAISLVPKDKEKADKWYLGKNLGRKQRQQNQEPATAELDSGGWYPGKFVGKGRPGLSWPKPAEHPSTLAARLDYAVALATAGSRQAVEGLNLGDVVYRQITDFGAGAPETLGLMDKYAALLQLQGNHREATMVCKEIVRERSAVLGPHHRDTLRSKFVLAASYVEMAQWMDVAALELEHSLQLLEQSLGGAHPDTVSSRMKLGGLLYQQAHFARALQCFEQCYEHRCASLGDTHVLTLGAANNIGAVLASMGRATEGRSILERTLHAVTTAGGEDQPAAIGVMINLVNQLQSAGELSAAEQLMERATRVAERALGDSRKPFTAACLICILLFTYPLLRRCLLTRPLLTGPLEPALSAVYAQTGVVRSRGHW